MIGFPTADQIAWAIVAAARECGEDPIAVAKGADGSRARTYAYAALRLRFPNAPIARLAVCCGAKKPHHLIASASNWPFRFAWWDESIIGRTKAAIPEAARVVGVGPGYPVVETESGERAAIQRAPAKPAAAMCPNPIVRRPPPARSGDVVTASIAGDPSPGRSALAQGYKPGSGIARGRE